MKPTGYLIAKLPKGLLGLQLCAPLTILGLSGTALLAQQPPHQPQNNQQWKTVPFAIVRYNDDAPKAWNVYHGEKKGIYLVRIWKRYLLINTADQSVNDIDPSKVQDSGESDELNSEDVPSHPIQTADWNSLDSGPVVRHRFRIGQTGNFMELQIPLLANGKPAY